MTQPQLEVLVVDDDESVRRGLRLMGLSVRLAATGKEALDLYRQHRDSIGVVLLDVRMPGLDDPQTLTALRQIDPQVRVVFLTADAAANRHALGDAHVITKPFQLDELVDKLRKLAGAAGA
jgi:CheY-like chemotaxis protein